MGYSDANYQMGKMLHQEYEAKYSLPVELLSPAEDSKRIPFKTASLTIAVVIAGFFIALSLLI